MIRPIIAILSVLMISSLAAAQPTVIVAEGEFFTPQPGAKAGQEWKLTPQDESHASHSYGGMWVMNGALIGAPADSVDAVATRKITVPAAGAYRVWSKYQAPPYFNYLHKIEIAQNGQTVYSQIYGKVDSPRMWSFSAGMHPQIWWPWGIDHDAAEAPKALATLAAGEAELRITSVAQPEMGGDRYIDSIILTTEPGDTYTSFRPYGVGSPFMLEAIAASRVYARFKNTTAAPAVLSVQTPVGHLQPLYGAQSAEFPAKDQPVAAGAWSPWFNIASICRLVHDEGLMATLPGAPAVEMQVARDAEGKDLVGDFKVPSGEAFVIPIDIAWNKNAKVLPSSQLAANIVAQSKKWRTANGGKKPQKIAFYGRFINQASGPWAQQLQDALGYNTQLPDTYSHIKRDGYFAHTPDVASVQKYAASLTPEQRANMRILSFGDEIHLGEIDYNNAENLTKFRAWLQKKGITKDDLGGTEPAAAPLSKTASPQVAWYANLFSEEERFATFAATTKAAEQAFHPDVLTGANYSPHIAPQYYGPIYQWVDLFKHRGMKAFWTEDYIFSIPESPQIISWMFATMRCAVKYNNQPIHFYVMPHAPGQTAANLRKNMMFAVGAGSLDIDNFWVAPAENFTENFVAWGYPDTFRTIHETIFDSAEVEDISVGGKPRPARVAIVLSKATDFNEPKVPIEPKDDPFSKVGGNIVSPGDVKQIICRKDQQLLYLALKNAQYGVELVTEDDIVEGVNGKDILPNYDVIYFAGEWVDNRAARKLDAWVNGGGVLYVTAGLGHLNQFNQPEKTLLGTLGLQSVTVTKNAYHLRPMLELPLAMPIDSITLDGGEKVDAIAMKQVLTVDPASGAKVIGKWADGTAAVTSRDVGKGKAIAVGTLAGHSFFKTGTKVRPWGRGGNKNPYAPLDFAPAATKLALLGVAAKPDIAKDLVTSDGHVEGIVLDNEKGTLVTLVNWANTPAKGVKVTLKLPFKPSSVKLVSGQSAVPVTHENGVATFTLDVPEAEFIILNK